MTARYDYTAEGWREADRTPDAWHDASYHTLTALGERITRDERRKTWRQLIGAGVLVFAMFGLGAAIETVWTIWNAAILENTP